MINFDEKVSLMALHGYTFDNFSDSVTSVCGRVLTCNPSEVVFCTMGFNIMLSDRLDFDRLERVGGWFHVSALSCVNIPKLSKIDEWICIEGNESLVKQVLELCPDNEWHINEKACRYLIDNPPINSKFMIDGCFFQG